MLALVPLMHGAQNSGLTKNVLTNRDLATLASAGFTEEFIIHMIATSQTKFDVSADALADLAKNGLTEEIIEAMRCSRNKPRQFCVPSGTTVPTLRNVCGENGRPGRVFVEASPNFRAERKSYSQTAEVMQTFGENCPGLAVTNRREDATFVVVVDRGPGKWLRRGSKMVVFDRSGDMVFQASKRALGKAVRNFCLASQIAPAYIPRQEGGTTTP